MPSRDRSLRRIRTESVKTMPRTPLPVKERPCPDATLQGSYILDWLSRR